MNLNQLRFVQAVAGTGSFTTAASQCFVTQPTLSNGIAQLEAELGERLFVRTTRSVALTAFGEHLLPYIEDVLRAQSSLKLQAQALLNPTKTLLRIGASPLVSAHLLGLTVEAFTRDHADLEIVLREMNLTELYGLLVDGRLDFVIGVANVIKGPWTTAPLYRERLYFVPPGPRWLCQSALRSVKVKDIADETFVMVPDACGLARATRALFRSHRRRLREYSGEAMSYQVLEQWAELGIGAAIMPESKLSMSASQARRILDKSGTEVSLEFDAAWMHRHTNPAAHQSFARHLRDVVPAILAGARSDHQPDNRRANEKSASCGPHRQ